MKKETEEQMNELCDKVLIGLTPHQMETAKALCRAGYKMGYDHGKQNSTLEIIGADALIAELNKTS